MNRLGVELLTVFGLPPVQFVNLAANAGCGNISMALSQFPADPYGHPSWSLRDNSTLRRELVAALADRNITISLGEGFAVRQGVDVRDYARDIGLMRELGVRRINTVAMEPDVSRCLDQIAQLVELASAAGIEETTLEFAPCLAIADLPGALAAIRHVRHPSLRLLVDTMHLIRSGSSVQDLAAIDPGLIGYIQLSDAPLVATNPDYMQEATFERLAPGTGELPLREILAALPRDLVVSLEVPQRAQAVVGVSSDEWVGRCVAAARDLLP